MIINHNLGAMNAQRQMSTNQNNMSNSMEKLSSGLRINRAGDDAAGLAISEKMRGQIRGLEQADRNAQDGVSMIQTAEGALNETHSILQRMRELAVQSSNDTNTTEDRQELQKEFDQLGEEIDRISGQTEFNTKKLLNGGETTTQFSLETPASPNNSATLAASSDALAADSSISFQETVTHGAEGTPSAGDGVFQSVSYSINDGSDDTTVEFTKAELDAGTTSKTATLNGVEYTIDASGVNSSSTGNGAAAATTDTYATGAGVETQQEKATFTFQIGANDGQNMELSISKMDTTSLGAAAGDKISDLLSSDAGVDGDLTSQSTADTAIATLDAAIQQVSAERSQLGANQNRLEHTINNLGTSAENLQSAESRIRDVDMAKEMMEMTKNNILSQASQSMLAQANQQPQSVLQLLQ